MKIVKTISRDSKRVTGGTTLYVNKNGQFQFSQKASQEFMINEKNYSDFGFLFHEDLFGNVYIEKTLIHKDPRCFPLGINKSRAFRFFSKKAIENLPGKALNFGEGNSLKLNIRFDKHTVVDSKILYPLELIIDKKHNE